jgi:hypothetical protein
MIVIDKLVEVLATQPGAVLPSTAMGARRPASAAELPAITVAVTVDDTQGTGLSRFRRAGDVVVRHVGTVVVQPTPDTFTSDLRSLRVAPLPLKKNPASTTSTLGTGDVEVRNVTTAGSPVVYTMVERPTAPTEFALDAMEARLVFGAAQTPGDVLEVVHWTVTWRDDILGDTYRGALTLDVLASQFSQTDQIIRNVQARLQTQGQLVRQKGFQRVQPTSLALAEQVLFSPVSGSPFAVWQQRLSYRFVFEHEEGGELSSGIPIKQIDVEVRQPPESFSVP